MKQEKQRRKALFQAETHRRWMHWLETIGAPLRVARLPDEVLFDEDHWNDFCTHACLHMHHSKTGFTVDDIGDIEAKPLLEFLHTYLEPEEKPYSALYRNLLRRFNQLEED